MNDVYNIYCDESCHLEHDNSDIMVIGGIKCQKSLSFSFNKKIRSIKLKHGLDKKYEVKWTKISENKLPFYKDLVDFFCENSINFRCVVIKNKHNLRNQEFNQTYNEWYYKMFYLLLSKMLEPLNEFNIYLDIKDTIGGNKAKKLKTILGNCLYDFSGDCLKKLQLIKSHESELLQVCDLLIGAVCFFNRFYKDDFCNRSNAKIELCNYIIEKTGRPLTSTTPINDEKFNILIWRPRS